MISSGQNVSFHVSKPRIYLPFASNTWQCFKKSASILVLSYFLNNKIEIHNFFMEPF